jgi:hypothetical protein
MWWTGPLSYMAFPASLPASKRLLTATRTSSVEDKEYVLYE